MENLLKTYAPAILTMKLKTQVQDMTSYVILLISNFKSRQRQILETITIGQKSPNSPALIPPQMFLSELVHIRGEINSRDLDLPLEPKTESLTMFYSISKKWHYVNTTKNPADLLSRGCLPDNLNTF